MMHSAGLPRRSTDPPEEDFFAQFLARTDEQADAAATGAGAGAAASSAAHALVGKRTFAASAADDSSLLPATYAPCQLFRTRASVDQPATFHHLPRIIFQLVNGFLSLMEIGRWCPTSRDIYATCAFFRCPLNSARGGTRHRWLAVGEVSREKIDAILKSPLRIHVTVLEASDPRGGLLKPGDCDRFRNLPYLTDMHAHWTWDNPFDYADEVTRLLLKTDVIPLTAEEQKATEEAAASDSLPISSSSASVSSASSSSSSSSSSRPLILRTASLKPAPLPPFRSFMWCPHDPHLDGDEMEPVPPGEESPDDILEDAATHTTYSLSRASQLADELKEDPEAGPKKKVLRWRKVLPLDAQGKKRKKTQDMTPAELLAEEQELVAQEKQHLAQWAIYNEKFFRRLHLFSSLDTLGLNLLGESTHLDVSGFSELHNLVSLELDIEAPWHYAFARQISQIIEFIRDVPYRRLHRFKSNCLVTKHLQQLCRPRHPPGSSSSSSFEAPIPALSTLWHFQVYRTETRVPDAVQPAVDAWIQEQDNRYILPYVKLTSEELEQMTDAKREKRLAEACKDLTADQLLDLYQHLPLIRHLSLIDLRAPLSATGYQRLAELIPEVDTLGVGGMRSPRRRHAHHPEEEDEHDHSDDDQDDDDNEDDDDEDDLDDANGLEDVPDAEARLRRLYNRRNPKMNNIFVQSMGRVAAKHQPVERLTISYMQLCDASSDDEDGWTPVPPTQATPLHDVLRFFAPNLLELHLTCIRGMKDLTALHCCVELLTLKLTGPLGFQITEKMIEELAMHLTQLRCLRFSGLILPDKLLDRLMIPSPLFPTLNEFSAERPHLAMMDQHGDLGDIALDLTALQGLPVWLQNWLQTQLQNAVAHAHAHGHAPPVAHAPPQPAPVVFAPVGAALGPQYQALFAQMFGQQGGVNAAANALGEGELDDLPELIDEQLNANAENGDESDASDADSVLSVD